MWKAIGANGVGIGLAFLLSLGIGLIWPVNIGSHELMSRTDAQLDSIALALASGAAKATRAKTLYLLIWVVPLVRLVAAISLRGAA